MNKEHRIKNVSSYTIWRNYIIGTIALSLVPIIASIVDKHWIVSLFFLCVSLSLFTFVKLNRGCKYETCVLVPFVIARIFLVLTILTVCLNIYVHRWEDDALGLLVYEHFSLFYPLVAISVILVHLRIKMNNKLCADCVARKGNPYERASLGIAFYAEVNYLLKRIAGINFIILILTWGIGIAKYYTGHLSSFFAFVGMFAPIIIFATEGLISGFVRYVAYRYNLIEALQSPGLDKANTKFIRITLLSDRAVYYSQKCGDTELDTPLRFSENYHSGSSEVSVRKYLNEKIGLDAYDRIKLGYVTEYPENNCSIEHYMCFVKKESLSDALEKDTNEIGVWLEKYQLEEAFSQNIFSRMVCSELHRVFVVMQGFKEMEYQNKKSDTKDFALSELKTTMVDFSDSGWLLKSDIKDGNFLKNIKRLWHRYVEGFN